MQTRRDFLTSSALVLTSAALPPSARAAKNDEAARLHEYFDRTAAEILRRRPELTTSLGLDKGTLAWTKSEWLDASAAANADWVAWLKARVAELRAIDRSQLSAADAVNYDTVEFLLATRDEAHQKFAYGEPGGGAPYRVSQLHGAYHEVPSFLETQHRIEVTSDADAYLARLEGFGRLLDQELELVKHDAGLGVTPPDFVIDQTLTQLQALLAEAAEESRLVKSLARRAKEKKLQGDWAEQARLLFVEKVRPALERQARLLEQLRPMAVHDAGLWRLPRGEEYYQHALQFFTTAKVSPDEVHKTGLEVVASLKVEIDKRMREAGYDKGSVGERFRQLTSDPKHLYPNTPEGKAKLLSQLNEYVKVVTRRLPEWFGQLPKAPLEIRAVPRELETAAPSGYYYAASLDGSRAGIYWINLRDTSELAAWKLRTTAYHEGIPGHHLQLSLRNESRDLPLLRKIGVFSGYAEGWALYTEQLVADMGMYEGDPLGHLGMLQAALFRAVRLVVDSGMHAKRWTREQALRYYIDNLGDREASAVTEIERYCVMPGQACGYMLGKLTWLRARSRAQNALGSKFDIRKFHDAALRMGTVPLAVLDGVIDRYVAITRGDDGAR
jgi:uncharacterized protein (DUF885 family)